MWRPMHRRNILESKRFRHWTRKYLEAFRRGMLLYSLWHLGWQGNNLIHFLVKWGLGYSNQCCVLGYLKPIGSTFNIYLLNVELLVLLSAYSYIQHLKKAMQEHSSLTCSKNLNLLQHLKFMVQIQHPSRLSPYVGPDAWFMQVLWNRAINK